MHRNLVILMVVAGCSKSATWEPDLSTPEAAARCQVVAIRTEDLAAWRTCMHPRLRDEFDRQVEKRASTAGFWPTMKERAKPLETAIPRDFVETAIPADKQTYGDRVARFRLDHDSFEIAHQNERWYVVDTGI